MVVGYGLEVPCAYIFEGDSFSCGWLQAKLPIKEEFDVHCGEPSKAYVCIMLCLDSC